MKHQFRMAALVGSLAIVASACGPSGSTTAPTTAPATGSTGTTAPVDTTAPTAAALSGTLTIWEAYGASGTSEKDAFEKIVGQVKAANPGLNVTTLDVPFNDLFNKFETSASTGEPDMYIAPNDSLPGEARDGLLADVSDLTDILKAAPYNTSDVALNAAMVDGKLYEIPESMKAVALFYRTDQFATAPATTADYLTNASKLGLVYGANGGGAYYQWGLYSSFGGKILDDSGKCAAGAGGVADSLKFLSDFKAAGGHLYQNDGDAKADFIAGTIGGFIDGPWMSGDLKTALGDKLAVAAGPTGPSGGAFAPMTAPDGFYINAASPNIDLAKQFALQFLLPANEQVFADAGHLPANTTLQPTDPIAQSFAALMPTGFARPTLAALNNYWGNFGNAIVAVVDKSTDPATEVTNACAAMDKANGL
jgi:arabinogalactan oligomer/maltooligosaccharide transport system substrate-binding protein